MVASGPGRAWTGPNWPCFNRTYPALADTLAKSELARGALLLLRRMLAKAGFSNVQLIQTADSLDT